jgi:glutamate-ammonia-ligase adenylyltransferase
LKRKVEAAIRAAQTRAADPAVILADAAAMRARMLRDLPAEGPWDVKLMQGGLVEVEFIAQALQVAHAHRLPAILSPTTREALAALAKARLLEPAEAEGLVAAERLWRAVVASPPDRRPLEGGGAARAGGRRPALGRRAAAAGAGR